MKPLAITGVGVVSPLGVGWSQWRERLQAPAVASERAFSRVPDVLNPEKVPRARAAQVWDFDAAEHLGPKGLRNFDRLTKFLIVAAKHALEEAGVKESGKFVRYDPTKVGVCSSTAYGSLDAITELNLVAELEDPRYINPARFPNTVINAAAGYVSIWEGLQAPNVTVVDGNCGSLDTVLTCETHLAHRRGEAFLVGGGEVLSEPLYLAFRKLGVVAEGAEPAEPGSPASMGMHIGEGAAYLCVEPLEAAVAQGASIRGEIIGYGTAFDVPPSEAMLAHASPDSVARAVASALRDAGMEPSDVQAVCSAASGIEYMDKAEREGLEALFGKDICIAAPKTVFGETFGAAGALGMATALAWFDGAPVKPRIGGNPCVEPRIVVVTAVGYYGNVSAVVMKRAEPCSE